MVLHAAGMHTMGNILIRRSSSCLCVRHHVAGSFYLIPGANNTAQAYSVVHYDGGVLRNMTCPFNKTFAATSSVVNLNIGMGDMGSFAGECSTYFV